MPQGNRYNPSCEEDYIATAGTEAHIFDTGAHFEHRSPPVTPPDFTANYQGPNPDMRCLTCVWYCTCNQFHNEFSPKATRFGCCGQWGVGLKRQGAGP